MTIGERIKALRKKNDLTQEKLAERIGTRQRNISNWETGICEPDIVTLYLIAKALDVDIQELFIVEKEE